MSASTKASRHQDILVALKAALGGKVKKASDLDAKEWEAVFKVMDGFKEVFGSISAFAEIIECKRPMLSMRYNDRRTGGSSPGVKRTFSKEEEEAMTDHLKAQELVGNCMPPALAIVAATKFAKERKLQKATVSRKMLKGVYKRAKMSVKRGDPTSRARLLSVSKTNMAAWFKHLEAAGVRETPAERSFNADETHLNGKEKKGRKVSWPTQA